MRQFMSFICGALVATALTVGMLTVPAQSAPVDGNTSSTSLDDSSPTASSDQEKAAQKKAAKAKKKAAKAKKAAKKKARAKAKKAAKKRAKAKKVKRLKQRPLRALKRARTRAGMSYRYGSSGPHAFDCSGLVRWAYAKVGKNLPRTSGAQAASTKRTKKPRKGDLVFFHNRGRVYHVGLYAGGNKVFHASRPGKPVGKERIWSRSVFYGRA
ncbi:C40 family peptidase [Nocardioides gilvus]|uniref:C40 family peptidase n=1 Tax=Nocardioides gilvus TaxID=1735589 RepID=UPI0013A5744F|nr:C40 family peptidase [Nocardioides gilvus]